MIDERSVEVPWLIARLGRPKRILDVGAAGAKYLEVLTLIADEVFALDTRAFAAPAGVQAFVGDAHAMPAEWSERFGVVTCVSTIDHIGLRAYGNEANPFALETAVSETWRVLRSGGRLLVTAPFGRDQVTTHPGGEQRVFGMEALRKLFDEARWEWLGRWFWRLLDEQYVGAIERDCTRAEYDSFRAQAIVALALAKR